MGVRELWALGYSLFQSLKGSRIASSGRARRIAPHSPGPPRSVPRHPKCGRAHHVLCHAACVAAPRAWCWRARVGTGFLLALCCSEVFFYRRRFAWSLGGTFPLWGCGGGGRGGAEQVTRRLGEGLVRKALANDTLWLTFA